MGRRGFLAAGAGAFLCTIGGQRVSLSRPGDAAKADAAAARVARPRAKAASAAPGAGPTEKLTFATPGPQPGGTRREYWIQARDTAWTIIPHKLDEWHDRPVPGKSSYRAFVYQEYTPGFAAPKGPAQIPGPTLYAEVGDVLVVHFRNGLSEKYGQAVTMHPHGVKYNPEYDGVYLGAFTRAGGFIEPGEEFTYTWEVTPDSVGVWPYHDHGPNHTLNTFRGLFRTFQSFVLAGRMNVAGVGIKDARVLEIFAVRITPWKDFLHGEPGGAIPLEEKSALSRSGIRPPWSLRTDRCIQ